MEAPAPRVSIGLPVYNGERFLVQAVESILAQTYRDFELIISDNASTDSTPDICGRFAAQDERIVYSRNPVNIGGVRNENRTLGLARGEYFRFAAHDDFLEPQLLERCVAVLDARPEVVSCHTMVNQVDEITGVNSVISRTGCTVPDAAARFSSIVLGRTFLEENYGLIRASELRRVAPQHNYVGSDRPFMAELALLGPFAEVPEVLFNKRFHDANLYVDWRTRVGWFKPEASGSFSFPWWAQFGDLVRRTAGVQVRTSTRLRCAGTIARWAVVRAPNLAKDLLIALRWMSRGRAWRDEQARRTANWEHAEVQDTPAS